MNQLAIQLQSRPFVVLLIPLAAGICLAQVFEVHVPFWILFSLSFCCIAIVVILMFIPQWIYLNLCFSFSLGLLIACYGYCIVQQENQLLAGNARAFSTITVIKATIAEKPVLRNHFYKAVMVIDSSAYSELNDKKIIVRLPEVKDQNLIKAGMCFRGMMRISSISGTDNPYDFDYAGFMALRDVYYQGSLINENWHLSATQGRVSISIKAMQIREYLLSRFSKYKIADRELAVISALTLGYKDLLDQQIKQAYSSSGTIHILAVSGMHAGLVYIMLLAFIKPIKNKTWRKRAELIAGLPLIWLYALLTGLSPSVTRATLMLSVVIAGQVFKKPTDIYNTIAGVAFIMLVSAPDLLFNAGFQLSFLAVTGIVAFYEPVYLLVKSDHYFIDHAWKLVSVAIAAQILTFPVSLYHFHQFPNYFLFSNVLVVPFATLLIYGGMLFFIISYIPFIAVPYAWLIEKSTALLNQAVMFIEQLPGSVTSGIAMSAFETVLIYLILFFIIVYIRYPLYKYLVFACMGVIFYLAVRQYYTYRVQSCNELVVWNKSGQSLYSIQSGSSMYLVALQNPGDAALTVRNHAARNRVSELGVVSLFNGEEVTAWFKSKNISGFSNLLVIGTTKILFCTDKTVQFLRQTEPFQCDIAIISQNAVITPFDFEKKIQAHCIVCDATFPKHRAEAWQRFCKLRGIVFYSVQNYGSYHINL